MFKYTFIVSCLILLIASCGADAPQDDNSQVNIVSPITETSDSIAIDEPVEVLTGFPRFFFVKDSLGLELENAKILADTYTSEKIYFNQLEKDTAYFIILDFLKEIRIAPEDDKALYEYNEVKESEIGKYYKSYGITIESAEGEYYCVPDYMYLADLFKGDLNPELDIYKDFLVVKNRHIFDDGGLMITWMRLASQILETEDFYAELKWTQYADEVFQEYLRVSHPLMFGTENSLILDSNDSIKFLLPDVNDAYELLIKDDSLHNSGIIFKEHLNNLKDVNFDLTNDSFVRMPRLEIDKNLKLITPAQYNEQHSE